MILHLSDFDFEEQTLIDEIMDLASYLYEDKNYTVFANQDSTIKLFKIDRDGRIYFHIREIAPIGYVSFQDIENYIMEKFKTSE